VSHSPAAPHATLAELIRWYGDTGDGCSTGTLDGNTLVIETTAAGQQEIGASPLRLAQPRSARSRVAPTLVADSKPGDRTVFPAAGMSTRASAVDIILSGRRRLK